MSTLNETLAIAQEIANSTDQTVYFDCYVDGQQNSTYSDHVHADSRKPNANVGIPVIDADHTTAANHLHIHSSNPEVADLYLYYENGTTYYTLDLTGGAQNPLPGTELVGGSYPELQETNLIAVAETNANGGWMVGVLDDPAP